MKEVKSKRKKVRNFLKIISAMGAIATGDLNADNELNFQNSTNNHNSQEIIDHRTESIRWMPRMMLDWDYSGKVDFGDFLKLAVNFGDEVNKDRNNVEYDINKDGNINFADFAIFANKFGTEQKGDLEFEVSSAFGKEGIIETNVSIPANETDASYVKVNNKIPNLFKNTQYLEGIIIETIDLNPFEGDVEVSVVNYVREKFGDNFGHNPVEGGKVIYHVPRLLYVGSRNKLVIRFFKDEEEYQKEISNALVRKYDREHPDQVKIFYGNKPEKIYIHLTGGGYFNFSQLTINGNSLNSGDLGKYIGDVPIPIEFKAKNSNVIELYNLWVNYVVADGPIGKPPKKDNSDRY